MSELSKYIKKELSTILTQIHTTPTKKPKKSASLQKIRQLVEQAPMVEHEKKSINKSIRKIQSAMTGQKKLTIMPKNQYAKNLFYENMFMEEKNLNFKKIPLQSKQQNQDQEYNILINKLNELRQVKLKRDNYLSDLIIKSQRLERLIELKLQNHDKYLKSKMLDDSGHYKKKSEEIIMQKTREAAKGNRKKIVHTLISKYNNFMMA